MGRSHFGEARIGRPVLLLALALTGALGLWLARAAFAAGRERKRARAEYFAPCRALFEAPVERIQPTGFPRLLGRRGGHLYDLQMVPDTLTFRKLPALWLLASLIEPLPLPGTFSLMLRPRGGEIFSRHCDLPHALTPLPGFPADCAIRTDAPGAPPPEAAIRRLAGLAADPRLKEAVLSPAGLRLVWLAEEAERTRYLLFRDAEMGRHPLDPASLAPIIEALAALRADIREGGA